MATNFGNSYFMNVGPEPASGMGICRLVVQLDGEIVRRVDSHIGYSHRGIEKQLENQNTFQALAFCDRLYRDVPFIGAYSFVLAVERLLEVNIPERAAYIRILFAEMARIQSHLKFIACLAADTGCDTVLPIAESECFRILSLCRKICNECSLAVFFRAGGVRNDLTENAADLVMNWADKEFPSVMAEIEDFLTENRLFKSRTVGIGVISDEDALDYGFSGVNLRACGIAHDLRKTDIPYDVYDKVNFEIPVKKEGDCYARYILRVHEIFQSLAIIRQVISDLPAGRVMAPEIDVTDDKSLLMLSRRYLFYSEGMPLPVGDIYAATESPFGELGVYLVSEGGAVPYRCHFRSAGLPHLQALNIMAAGHDLADLRPILSSLNIVMTEVDR